MNPINKILHVIGLPIYAAGLSFVIGYFVGLGTNPLAELSMWLIAVCLFLLGHYIEGNMRAVTMIIIFKYLRSRTVLLSKSSKYRFSG